MSEIVAQINGFHPEQSIFFCDFATAPASSVTTYFNSYAYLPLPVNCQHRSQYGGDRSISALDDWFAAFEKLSEHRDPKE